MKRVFSSKSGHDSYGPKWHNIESSTESKRDDELHPPPLNSTETDQVSIIDIEAAKPESPTVTGHGENTENQIPKGNENAESMYKAALEGDWTNAEKIMNEHPNLACDHITEEGDRALHMAAATKRKEFVQKLVERMSPSDLELHDGRGYTACCYAAMSGAVEIARVMIGKNPNLATARDRNKQTPLHKAALQGNKEMVSYFLKCSKVEDLSEQEWFDLLLVTIRGRIYDVALEILGKNGSMATMENEEGTALHLLARQAAISNTRSDSTREIPAEFAAEFLLTNLNHTLLDYGDGERDSPDFNKLAKELWNEMQKLGKSSLLERIKVPHSILHDAAKEGHVELVVMLIRTYPQLIRDTDSNGYTIFHTAAKYRHIRLFNLIYHVNPMTDLTTLMSQDESGDNILHLAAKSGPPNKMKLPPVLLLQRELQWFKDAEEILPPSCVMMRNKKKLRPRDLFSKEHETLLKNSEMWLRNTADSCMLITTILLTVVFAAAFTVPGGYDPQTGEPHLSKKHWFKAFIVFEVLGFLASVISLVLFRCIMASRFTEEDFLSTLPTLQMFGFYAMLVSLVCTFSVFMSSIALYNQKMNGLVWFGFCLLYFLGFFWLIAESAAIVVHYIGGRTIELIGHNIFDPPPSNSLLHMVLRLLGFK